MTHLRVPLRVTALAVTAGSVLGLFYGVSVVPGAVAATGEADSSITVAWASGEVVVGSAATATAAEVRAVQPNHAALTSDGNGADAGSGHWDDFRDLSVSVDSTTGLGDQSISVTVSGFSSGTDYLGGGSAIGNYVQAMQCWGADPNASDFWQTCQFGSLSRAANVQNVVGQYSKTRGLADIPDAVTESTFTPYPFRAVTGQVSAPALNVQPGGSHATVYSDGLEPFFTSSSSNELVFQPADAEGRAVFGFATQSAVTQPYLGCGDAAGARCWLVIVPRGQHSGVRPETAGITEICDTDNGHVFGQKTSRQEGSPVAPDCSFFDDRIVIPLDFDATRPACAAGARERRAAGSEFIADAYSSWQQALCAETGTAYSLNTNSGNLTREQLLTGQAKLAIVSRRLASGTIGSADPGLLADADIVYAPLANTGLVFAFTFTTPTRIHDELKLTPRLIAKLLTQSYEADIPFAGSGAGAASVSRDKLDNPESLQQDPEWAALKNPGFNQSSPQLIVVGPQGDDAIALLWEYLRSDADARAFLNGEADPWGMRINPYYLPSANSDALDGGFDLFADSLDTFPKADRSVAPEAAEAESAFLGQTIDSTSFSPYSGTFEANASRVVRVDAGQANQWDRDRGRWSAPSPPLANSERFAMGVATAPDAADYNLASASIALPVAQITDAGTVLKGRTFIAPSDETLAAAVGGAGYDPVGGGATDFSALPGDAYPLTLTLYAAANRADTGLDDAARADYSALLTYAGGAGQERGERPGQLPEGYVPLTDAQRAATADAAARILTRPPQEPVEVPPGAAAAAVVPPVSASADPTGGGQVTATAATASEATGAFAGSIALGGGLVAGLAGLASSPFLLRRRALGG
ncbi:hypothetical protein [Microbacterium sp. NPDC057944]|uniref:hypothetical protein n=1 Tax=Microbacterium sp. NPDC057944 TaxID=3346286 RepID=UPI0036DCDFE1